MKVLITGGAGYVGNALVQQLVSDEQISAIHIYDNLSRGRHVLLQQTTQSSKLKFIEADILDNYSLQKALQEVAVVIHLATVRHPEHHYMEQINHWGTANLINNMEGYSIKKFIFLSTADVYANSPEEITVEKEDFAKSAFAQSMLRAENYVKTLSNKCEVAVVRSAAVYGYNPAMLFTSGINRHVFDAKYNNLLQLDGDGIHSQSAIHVNELAKILSKLTLQKNKLEQILYLATTQQWSGMEIYEALKEFFPSLEATFTSHHLRLTDQLLKADKISSLLLENKTSLPTAIEEILSKTNY